MSARRRMRPGPRTQTGAVLLLGLIVLTIMLIGSLAMMRSVETSASNSGNLAFKRDLGNQAERAAQRVRTLFATGALSTEPARDAHAQGSNYRASMLPDNAQGIPTALFDDALFATVGDPVNDIVLTENGVQVARIRYLLDRLCDAPGAPAVDRCVTEPIDLPGGSATEMNSAENASASGAGALPQPILYRLSVRVDGPRGTRGFYQSTYAM